MSKISKWKQKEDAEMKKHVTMYGACNWRDVAHSLGRSANSCLLRWRDHLSPDIDDSAITNEEAITITRLRREYGGNKWAKIATTMCEMRSDNRKRTANKVKNFWNRGAVKKKISGVEETTPPPPPPDIDLGQDPISPEDNSGYGSGINCDYNIGNASYSTVPAAVDSFCYGSYYSTVPEINCAVDTSYSTAPEVNRGYAVDNFGSNCTGYAAVLDNLGNASYLDIPEINNPVDNFGYGSNFTVPEINGVDNFGYGSYSAVPEINAEDNFGYGSYSSSVPEINIGNGVF